MTKYILQIFDRKQPFRMRMTVWKNVIGSIENNMPEDFYSIDLMDAYEALGSITGET